MASDHVTASRDGVHLAVDVHRAASPGAPQLLLIPGLGSSRAVMAPLIAELSGRVTCIVFDPRGIGDSEMGEPPLTLAQLGDDCADVIADIADGEAAVFGASMGGMVAQHLTLDHRDCVSRLVLAATTPGGSATVARNHHVRQRLLGHGARTPEAAYRIACTVLYSDAFQHEHPEFIEAQVQQRAAHPVRAPVFSAQNRASQAHDVLSRLSQLQLPVLVMHGTDDMVVPLANAELLAARIPGAQHCWFEGCGHLFFHEQPRRSAEVIGDFLSR